MRGFFAASFWKLRASSLNTEHASLLRSLAGCDPEGRPPALKPVLLLPPGWPPVLLSSVQSLRLWESQAPRKTHIEYKDVCYDHLSVIVVNISFLIKVLKVILLS